MSGADQDNHFHNITSDSKYWHLEAQVIFNFGKAFKVEVGVIRLDTSYIHLMFEVCGRMKNGPKDAHVLIPGTGKCEPRTEKESSQV